MPRKAGSTNKAKSVRVSISLVSAQFIFNDVDIREMRDDEGEVICYTATASSGRKFRNKNLSSLCQHLYNEKGSLGVPRGEEIIDDEIDDEAENFSEDEDEEIEEEEDDATLEFALA